MENIFMIIKDKKEFFELLDEWHASGNPSGRSETKEADEVYFSQREAARFLRISLPTLISWKKARKIPFYQHGRKVLYKRSEVLEALKNEVI